MDNVVIKASERMKELYEQTLADYGHADIALKGASVMLAEIAGEMPNEIAECTVPEFNNIYAHDVWMFGRLQTMLRTGWEHTYPKTMIDFIVEVCQNVTETSDVELEEGNS